MYKQTQANWKFIFHGQLDLILISVFNLTRNAENQETLLPPLLFLYKEYKSSTELCKLNRITLKSKSPEKTKAFVKLKM